MHCTRHSMVLKTAWKIVSTEHLSENEIDL